MGQVDLGPDNGTSNNNMEVRLDLVRSVKDGLG